MTYRNSYFVYPKNLFSMTLNLRIKVKWYMCLALPYFRQKWQQDCLQIPSKLPRIHGILLSTLYLFRIFEIFLHFGGNLVNFCNNKPLKRHNCSILGIKFFQKTLLLLLASICHNDI